MRITYRAISNNTIKEITKRYNDLAKIQEMLSTGKQLLRPSDNPIDVSNDLGLRSQIKQFEQYKKNIDNGLGFMQVADTALTDVDSVMQRIRELTIQASSDTQTAINRKQILSEVAQLTRQIVTLMNTSYKGDFIFAGTQTKIMPFPLSESKASTQDDYDNYRMAVYTATAPSTAVQIRDAFTHEPVANIIPGSFKIRTGTQDYFEGTDYTIDYSTGMFTPIHANLVADVSNPANYQPGAFKITFEYVGAGKDIYGERVSHNNYIFREIEKGISAPINLSADELLVNKDTGTNLLTTVIHLGQDLLYNNGSGIRASISEIDYSYTTLLTAQAKTGGMINRFELTSERNENQLLEITKLHSSLEDADMAEAATKFSVNQMVYEAALRSASKIIQPSLVNFL